MLRRLFALVLGLVIALAIILLPKESKYRYSLVVYTEQGGVGFVSIDPVERAVYLVSWPSNLEIKSRSVGSYQVGKLAELGSYEGQAGEFVRRKVQGFMKVPVGAYLFLPGDSLDKAAVVRGLLTSVVVHKGKTTLSRLDAVILAWRVASYEWRSEGVDELTREGIITREGEVYHYFPDRLQQYLELKIFDWGVSATGMTVAVINESEEAGLATDVARFLSNVGFDVISVRSGQRTDLASSEVTLSEEMIENSATAMQVLRWFSWGELKTGDTTASRADMVVRVGRDALTIF